MPGFGAAMTTVGGAMPQLQAAMTTVGGAIAPASEPRWPRSEV